jgi:pyruvate/2-oxoglutarate dehydrogenase complex dihydrolipoamide acyltransferase (E2) component
VSRRQLNNLSRKAGGKKMNRKLTSAVLAALLCVPFAASAEEAASAAPAASAAEAASVAPAASATSDATGTVVFFREKKFQGAAIRYKVRENGVELCKLASGTYCTVQVPVGKHQYVVHSEAKDVLTLEVDSGETYYVIGGISMGFLAGHPNLSPSTKAVFDGMKEKLKDNTGKDLGGADEDKKAK